MPLYTIDCHMDSMKKETNNLDRFDYSQKSNDLLKKTRIIQKN